MNIRVNLCLSVVFLLFAASTLASDDNPYQSIVDRNVFGLHPPPPPPSTEPPKPPIPAINLTGITTISGRKIAFMLIQLPAKAGEQPKPGPTSFTLTEGERDGDVEVISIDEKAGTVKVNEFGTITNVTFGKLPSTPAPTPAVASMGGVPNPHTPPIPGAVPGAPRSIPARTLRLGGNNPGGNNTGADGAMNGQVNPNAAGVAQPQAAGYQSQPNTPSAADYEAANRTPEENVLLYEANRLKNEQLIQAGAKLPRMPQHPWLGGSQGQPQPQ